MSASIASSTLSLSGTGTGSVIRPKSVSPQIACECTKEEVCACRNMLLTGATRSGESGNTPAPTPAPTCTEVESA
jgi:hypothetical protein